MLCISALRRLHGATARIGNGMRHWEERTSCLEELTTRVEAFIPVEIYRWKLNWQAIKAPALTIHSHLLGLHLSEQELRYELAWPQALFPWPRKHFGSRCAVGVRACQCLLG